MNMATIYQGEFIYYNEEGEEETFSMFRYPMNDIGNGKYKEWQVLRNGQWVDSVYFQSSIDRETVLRSLIEHDGYPNDIVILPVKNS